MVDYIYHIYICVYITPHDCLESCVDFKVIISTDLMNSNDATCIDLIREDVTYLIRVY